MEKLNELNNVKQNWAWHGQGWLSSLSFLSSLVSKLAAGEISHLDVFQAPHILEQPDLSRHLPLKCPEATSLFLHMMPDIVVLAPQAQNLHLHSVACAYSSPTPVWAGIHPLWSIPLCFRSSWTFICIIYLPWRVSGGWALDTPGWTGRTELGVGWA